MVTRKDYHFSQEGEATVVGQPAGHMTPDIYATGAGRNGEHNPDKFGNPHDKVIEDPYDHYGLDNKEGWAY